MRKYILCVALSLAVAALCTATARGAEPQMASYSSLPIFQSSSVMPNILIMLDNSGSMNFPAYPDPYNADVDGISDGTELLNATYTGVGCKISVHVANGDDDGEERLSDHKIYYCGTNMLTSPDLDLITDELQITAGVMPRIQIARRETGSASGPAGQMVPVLSIPAAAGFKVAGAFTNQTMSDAGTLPAAGRSGRAVFGQDMQAGLELAPQRYVPAQDAPGNMRLAASKTTTVKTTTVKTTTTTTVKTTTSSSTSTTSIPTTSTSTVKTTTTTSINYCSNEAGQVVGVHFQNIQIPRSVDGVPIVVTSAKIIFTAYATSSGEPTTLYIAGQAADNAATFNAGTSSSPTIANISGRAETSAKVTWADVPAWTADSQANATTPDLKTIVQEIINRPGWAAGNSMVFKITGTAGSRRRAHSYNSSASKSPILVIEYEPCVPKKYYGYFDATARYSYSTGAFRRNSSGEWSGNFLNWLTMRRVDVLRKALMGGKKPCETCNGSTHLLGASPPTAQNNRYWQTYYFAGGDDAPKPTPYNEAWYGVRDGKFYVKQTTDPSTPAFSTGGSNWTSYDASFIVEVAIDQTENPEMFCSEGPESGNPCGIIQKVGDQARWGNIWFNTSNEGGRISSPIGGGIRDIINDFQSTDMSTATPLAETLYTAMNYFAQDSSLPSGYANNALPSPVVKGSVKDPFYDKGSLIPCAKSFVLMLTDGVPTSDKNIPASIQSYDGDTNATTRSYASDGSDYLDDVALYSHVTDLRSDMEGMQNMSTYVIYAFGKDPTAKKLLMETAMSGGFDDRNSNKKPDGYANNGNFTASPAAQRTEWDRNGDGIPDNFYEADDGYLLERQLLAAINAILNKAASGTAVSVLATTGEGEGTLVQAIFRPGITSGLSEVNWVGYLQSLWVDPKGNIREDTNKNNVLDLDVDKIITYYFDSQTKDTRVKRYPVSSSNPYPNMATTTSTDNISLEELAASAIWEAGGLLADRPSEERKIYTYVGDMPSISSPTAFGSGSCVAFTAANAAQIKPFLGVQDTLVGTYNYLGADIDKRSANLINFIRGNDQYGDGLGGASLEGPVSVRNRMLDGKVWKLGDIVYSTPVTITRPVEKYGLIYDDTSYQAYMDKYGDNATTARESVVYVGGNDGMLHAFTAGVFNKSNHGFAPRNGTSERIGDELWAYIPRALLPHLKWLASTSYDSLMHVPYVDLKPKIIDVRIFDDSALHPGGWGTVLVGGMNFGGKYIWVNNALGNVTGSYYSSYFAIDITDPRNPTLLWDKWFPGLGLTVNQPTVLSVGRTFNGPSKAWNNDDAWFLAIGSGFDDFECMLWTGQKGSLYIVDIKTGELKRQFQTLEAGSYMNTPIAIDKSLNYSVDAVYVAGNLYDASANWAQRSRVYCVRVPITNSPYIEGFEARYNKDPASWKWTKIVDDPDVPLVTAPFTISSDKKDNVWLYLGSGRYQVTLDKTNSTQNWLMGVKDPFYNLRGVTVGGTVAAPSCYHNYTATDCAVLHANLFYSNPYIIKPNNVVQPTTGGISSLTTWDKLMAEVRRTDTSTKQEVYQGWYRKLNLSGTLPSERMVNKPTVFGGIAVFPTYTPNTDTCGFGGNSRLYALYYETGTAYNLPVLVGPGVNNTTAIQDTLDLGYGLSSSFGIHAAREKNAGATLYSQMSTGLINEIDIKPAFSTKSGVENWKEGR